VENLFAARCQSSLPGTGDMSNLTGRTRVSQHIPGQLLSYWTMTDCVKNGTVKTLGYKPEGRGFETRYDEILNLPNPSGRTRPWGSLSL
jgi:hypothetical protein